MTPPTEASDRSSRIGTLLGWQALEDKVHITPWVNPTERKMKSFIEHKSSSHGTHTFEVRCGVAQTDKFVPLPP